MCTQMVTDELFSAAKWQQPKPASVTAWVSKSGLPTEWILFVSNSEWSVEICCQIEDHTL